MFINAFVFAPIDKKTQKPYFQRTQIIMSD